MEYILIQLIRFMKLAETVKSGKSGEEKKKFVLDAINNMLHGASEDVKILIPFLIDILIKVDKHQIKINDEVKKSVLGCLSCFNLR